MSGWDALEDFLRTDPLDAGCEETLDRLHEWVDLLVAGRAPERAMPGVAAHLRACEPCSEDLAGLVAVVRGWAS